LLIWIEGKRWSEKEVDGGGGEEEEEKEKRRKKGSREF